MYYDPGKEVLLETEGRCNSYFIIYTDGTYRCEHWVHGDLRRWAIINGEFKSAAPVQNDNDNFETDDSMWSEVYIKLAEKVEAAIAERILLGVDNN